MNRKQANELDDHIRKQLEEHSIQNKLNPQFGNIIMDRYLKIIPNTTKRELIFLNGEPASYKPGNIKLDLRSGLIAVAEFVASLSKPTSIFEYVQLVILSALCIGMISKKELDHNSAIAVYVLHKQNAYKTGITLEQLKNEIERIPDGSFLEDFEIEKLDKVINNLLKWKIIDIEEGKLYLKELVWGNIKM